MYNKVSKNNFALYSKLVSLTGIKPSEIHKLTWSDISNNVSYEKPITISNQNLFMFCDDDKNENTTLPDLLLIYDFVHTYPYLLIPL